MRFVFNPLSHPIIFSNPRRLTQFSTWHEHIPFAMFLVDVLRPELIVELGTQHGDSYCAFCQAVQELKLSTRCYAVDTWEGDAHSGFYGPEVLADLRLHHDGIYGSFSRLLKTTFDDALKHFFNGSIDLLHIDGYHTYESVQHDFESWLPKMSPRGVVLLHDINVREGDFGAWRFWEELKTRYRHFEFAHGHGLGVIAVGGEQLQPLKSLLQASLEDVVRIRNFFFNVGSRLTVAVGCRAQVAAARQDQLTRLQERLTERDQRITELRAALATALREVDTKEKVLAGIYNSHGWRALSSYYRARNTIFPIGSRRRAIARLAFNLAWRPRMFFDGVGFSNLQRFFRLSFATPPAQLEEQLNRALSVASFAIKGPRVSLASSTSRFPQTPTVFRLLSVRNYRVIYLVGCLQFESKRYRVSNLIEALTLGGIDADYVFDTEIPDKLSYVLSYDVIVIFRAGWTENLAILIAEAKRAGVAVVCDFDDYIFDRSVLPYVDGIRGWDSQAVTQYELGLLSYRKTVEHCDYFTAPTLFLKERAVLLGKKAYLIRNTANMRQLQISERLVQQRTEQVSAKKIVIGYFSGTKTHQRDFGTVCPALLRILSEFDYVFITLCGFLDLAEFPELAKFGSRLLRVPFVHWERLLHEIAKVDINIIPLELDNPFCDAKSELKYFEAGLVKVPSIASPTQTFKAIVQHGINGLLASNVEEWYQCLISLIADESLRAKIAANAYKDAVENYTTQALTKIAKNTYEAIIKDRREASGFSENAISILFIVVPPVRGSGGHKDIFLLANYLVELGNSVTVLFTTGGNFYSVEELRNFVAVEFCEPKFDVRIGNEVFSCDALIATHYSTAYVVRENAHWASRTFYFVQDYEPYFHPMGEEFIKAERTYTFGFQQITLGHWLKDVLDRKYRFSCESIPFWIEREIYYPRKVSRKPKIGFLARPEMSRRCFSLGLEALQIFNGRRPDVEIVLFGSEQTKHYSVHFRHVDLGVLSKPALAELYSEISLGLAFSTTNPSFVGYEMMACGCPVVDVDLDEDYDCSKYGSRENAILVEPDAEKIAEAIEQTLDDEDRRKTVGENGLRFVRSFPDVKAAALRFEQILRDALAQAVGDQSSLMQNGKPKEPDLTHCPGCGNLQRVRGSEVAQFIDTGRRLVLRCDRCAFLFIFPRFVESEIQDVDDNSEFRTVLEPQGRLEVLQHFADVIETFKPARGNCLELGSDGGYLLKILQTRGWKVEPVGLSETGRRKGCELGVEVCRGQLEEADLPLHSFDAIILWHVLERVLAPKDFLIKLRDLLKNDGLLLIQAPNFEKLLAYRKARRERELLRAIHVSCFTIESLRNLATSAGWSVHHSYLDDRNHSLTAVLKMVDLGWT